jgi:membrane protease YdiL (CAAX protease family)
MEEQPLEGQQEEEDQPGRDVIMILAIFFEGGLAPFSLFLGWLAGHPPLSQFSWSGVDALWGVAATIPLVVMFSIIMAFPIGPLGSVKKFWCEEAAPLLEESHWWELALVALSVGVGEEMLFRGVFQPVLTHWFGIVWGLLVSSLLFGLLHFISIPYVVMATMVGIYLGLIWIAGGNLLTIIVIHALYDFIVLVYLVLVRPSRKDDTVAS